MSAEVESIFEEFESLRPENVSFSLFVAHAVNEFIKSKKRNGKTLIEDENVKASYLNLLAPMDDWKREIHGLGSDEFKQVHSRLRQLNTLVDVEVHKRI